MKVLIGLILIFVGTTSAINDTNLTMDQWLKEIKTRHPRVANGQPFYNHINYLHNHEYCINDAIDIYNNRRTVLNFADANILIYGAGMDCLPAKDYAWKELIKSLINYYRSNMQDDKECFTMELKNIEPDSPLVSNFEANPSEADIAACDELIDNDGLAAHIRNIESKFGNLQELTCGAVNEQTLKKLFFKSVVLSSGKFDQQIDSMVDSMSKEAKEMLDGSFKCVKDRVKFGRRLINPTTVRTTTPATRVRSSTRNYDRNSGNQASSQNVAVPTGKMYNGYEVYLYAGARFIYVNNQWIQYIDMKT